MKKLLTALLLATCVFGLTACGAKKDDVTYDTEYVNALSETVYNMASAEYDAEFLDTIRNYDEYEWEQVESMWRTEVGVKMTGELLLGAIDSWQGSLEEIGTVSGLGDIEIAADADSVTAIVPVNGSEHKAEIEIVYDGRMAVQSFTLSVRYSMGELMEKAGLNTLLGMGTVFSVLILISLIISCFAFIPKIQAAFTKKPSEVEEKAKAVDHTIAQIIEKEELADDTELIAVIAAAIAAGEGAVSTDGFVVRSIKRANRRIR